MRPKCIWGHSNAQGVKSNGKNFSGLVGDLFNEYTDIGWANLFFNLEKAQFMDYSDAYIVDYGAFMVK